MSMAEGDADEIILDVTGLAPDVVTVDALARLQLASRRGGREIRLAQAGPDLLRLIELCGLADALPPATTDTE